MKSIFSRCPLVSFFIMAMTSAFPALLIYCIGFLILATWVYNHTRGSILFTRGRLAYNRTKEVRLGALESA